MDSYHDIKRLTPPISGWHIRVKVVRLFREFLDYPDKRLGLILSNESGTRIEAVVDPTLAYYYDEELKEGKWYTLTKFSLGPNNTQFRATDHAFKIYFLDETIVLPVLHEPLPLFMNRFSTFQSIIDDTINNMYLVDLVGAIFDVGRLENTAYNKADVDGFRVVFKIKDKDERVLECMALKKEALDFDRNYRMYGGGSIAVVLKWWKIYRFWDGPENVKICTNGPISKVSTNETIPEVEEIHEMLARTKEDVIVVDA